MIHLLRIDLAAERSDDGETAPAGNTDEETRFELPSRRARAPTNVFQMDRERVTVQLAREIFHRSIFIVFLAKGGGTFQFVFRGNFFCLFFFFFFFFWLVNTFNTALLASLIIFDLKYLNLESSEFLEPCEIMRHLLNKRSLLQRFCTLRNLNLEVCIELPKDFVAFD